MLFGCNDMSKHVACFLIVWQMSKDWIESGNFQILAFSQARPFLVGFKACKQRGEMNI
jgi:hypothetical protein